MGSNAPSCVECRSRMERAMAMTYFVTNLPFVSSPRHTLSYIFLRFFYEMKQENRPQINKAVPWVDRDLLSTSLGCEECGDAFRLQHQRGDKRRQRLARSGDQPDSGQAEDLRKLLGHDARPALGLDVREQHDDR